MIAPKKVPIMVGIPEEGRKRVAILAASGSPARSDGESRSQAGDVFLPYLALASQPISYLEVLDCSMGAV